MASRKQRIKNKRSEEENQIQQVRMAVMVVIAIVILGIGYFVIKDIGLFDPPPIDYSGSLTEICEQAKSAPEPTTRDYTQAKQVLEDDVDYQAVMCTDVGAIYVELFEDRTPITVNNMVFLAQNNYYNNTIFHRVLEGFMAQAGDPTGTGAGGPGYQFQDEVFPDLTFDRPYLLAMANAGAGTNGSQFFITFAPTEWLNGAHTIFGEVIDGKDVVDSIMLRDPQVPNAPATTLQALVIVTPDDVAGQ